MIKKIGMSIIGVVILIAWLGLVLTWQHENKYENCIAYGIFIIVLAVSLWESYSNAVENKGHTKNPIIVFWIISWIFCVIRTDPSAWGTCLLWIGWGMWIVFCVGMVAWILYMICADIREHRHG